MFKVGDVVECVDKTCGIAKGVISTVVWSDDSHYMLNNHPENGNSSFDATKMWAIPYFSSGWHKLHIPKTITQNGRTYVLEEPKFPEWVKDGAWVVNRESGFIYKIVELSEGNLVFNSNGIATELVTHENIDHYRPFEPSDWKWGMKAIHNAEKALVIGSLQSGNIEISKPSISYLIVAPERLTPTF